MSHYPEPHSQIRGEVEVVLGLSNCAAKKVQHATGVDISDLATKKDFIA